MSATPKPEAAQAEAAQPEAAKPEAAQPEAAQAEAAKPEAAQAEAAKPEAARAEAAKPEAAQAEAAQAEAAKPEAAQAEAAQAEAAQAEAAEASNPTAASSLAPADSLARGTPPSEVKPKRRVTSARSKSSQVMDLDDDAPIATPKSARKASEESTTKRRKVSKEPHAYTEYNQEKKPIPTACMTRTTDDGFKFLSWNVGTLKQLLAKNPKLICRLLEDERPDILGLSEHKLTENKAGEAILEELRSLLPEPFKLHVAYSKEKKGYSGVLVLIREASPRQPVNVHFGLVGAPSPHGPDLEGRVITVEYADFVAIKVYVPNSGDGLARLHHRIEEWDAQLRTHVNSWAPKKVLLAGDLNVAHLGIDIWNMDAPHIKKTPGTTVEERESFGRLLTECNLVDTFRSRYPADEGNTGFFSFWSVRAGNKPLNRGLRLDYVLASSSCSIKDAFILHEYAPAGDHCPVGAVVSL